MNKVKLPHKINCVQQIDRIIERLLRRKHQGTRMLRMLCRKEGISIATFYRELKILNMQHKLQGRRLQKAKKRKREMES